MFMGDVPYRLRLNASAPKCTNDPECIAHPNYWDKRGCSRLRRKSGQAAHRLFHDILV
jgi:hypothetical protein